MPTPGLDRIARLGRRILDGFHEALASKRWNTSGHLVSENKSLFAAFEQLVSEAVADDSRFQPLAEAIKALHIGKTIDGPTFLVTGDEFHCAAKLSRSEAQGASREAVAQFETALQAVEALAEEEAKYGPGLIQRLPRLGLTWSPSARTLWREGRSTPLTIPHKMCGSIIEKMIDVGDEYLPKKDLIASVQGTTRTTDDAFRKHLADARRLLKKLGVTIGDLKRSPDGYRLEEVASSSAS